MRVSRRNSCRRRSFGRDAVASPDGACGSKRAQSGLKAGSKRAQSGFRAGSSVGSGPRSARFRRRLGAWGEKRLRNRGSVAARVPPRRECPQRDWFAFTSLRVTAPGSPEPPQPESTVQARPEAFVRCRGAVSDWPRGNRCTLPGVGSGRVPTGRRTRVQCLRRRLAPTGESAPAVVQRHFETRFRRNVRLRLARMMRCSFLP